MGLFGSCLPIVCTAYSILLLFVGSTLAKPFESQSSDTHTNSDGSLDGTEFWIISAAGFLCISFGIVLCTCCKKPKGFAEFRGSTQLAELSPTQPGEVTLFPPPSLSLNREDLEVSFEPLPRPNQQAANTYRPKEITEWIENGYGLFPRSNIQYLRELSRGSFGQVVEAEAKELTLDHLSTRCVVKILRPEATVAQQCKFLKDVQPLLKITHQHVMKLYACCLESSPLLVLLQHCANGDLKQFLAAYSPSKGIMGLPPLPENVLLRMAYEAAEGLSQWHKAGFCHSDVAARSYMITGEMSIVIGDYGSNNVTYHEDFYDTGSHQIPVRWCAPECFQVTTDVIHTEAGNVWSFGVVLWEILSLGARPFATLTDEQVIQQVLQEKRTILNAPTYTYQQGHLLYQLMLQCWEIDPPLRPRIDVITSRLAAAHAGASRDIELDLEKEFDSRWNAAKPSRSTTSQGGESPSASLNNLHGSLDNLDEPFKEVLSPTTDKESVSGFSAKVSAALRSLDEALAAAEATDEGEQDDGPDEEPLPEPQFRLGSTQADQVGVEIEADEGSESSNGSLFSSRSWQDKVARGDLTALVREKSRSVQDLMVLTAVEPMSDIEFLAQSLTQTSLTQQGSKIEEHASTTSQPAAPLISITVASPSSTVRSPLMESDVPLLESTEDNCERNAIDTGTYLTRNRNRLTSTPREDTDFDAMESSFREQTKPLEYAPFSPESLDDTNFTRHDDESSVSSGVQIMEPTSPSSVILGPSEDLGLSVFQSVTSPRQGSNEDLAASDDLVVSLSAPEDEEDATAADPPQPTRLSVNLNAWNQFLEHGYPHQRPPPVPERPANDASRGSHQLKDSGIAPPSFSGSVDLLGGSTFNPNDTTNREWMDDLSLVARMWNEELAAALALDSSLINPHQLSTSLSDTDPNLEDALGNVSGLSGNLSYTSPLKSAREETYFSYDKIDDDIRSEEATGAIRKKDLSIIREERESVSSGDLGATPHSDIETGRELLEHLHMKNRIQRHLELSDSESELSEDVPDDDEDVLVVDLENKRAVMLEGQSPKLKVAMATQNYDNIFGPSPKSKENVRSVENGEHAEDDEEDEGAAGSEDDEGDYDVEQPNLEEEELEEGECEDGDEEEDGDDGIAVSNFIWQACYPAKFSHSYSMDVIEEECEDEEQEDEDPKPFVPSTWNADATPTKPAIKTPEKVLNDHADESGSSAATSGSSSPRKNVSFVEKRKKDIYEYEPVEVEEPVTPTRRQWNTSSNVIQTKNESSLAQFVDWDFATSDDSNDLDLDVVNEVKDVEDEKPAKPIIPRPPNPLTNSILYRLSGIEDESDETASDADLPKFCSDPSEETEKEDKWNGQFSSSEFQPNQYFAQPENGASETDETVEQEKAATNGENVMGILRHNIDSGRLFLNLTQSRSEEEDA